MIKKTMIAAMLATTVLAATAANAANDAMPLDASTPPKIVIEFYGFLSRAQLQCKFRYWNQNLTNLASTSKAKLESDNVDVRDLIAEGMMHFDNGAKNRGLKNACGWVAASFPNQVRP